MRGSRVVLRGHYVRMIINRTETCNQESLARMKRKKKRKNSVLLAKRLSFSYHETLRIYLSTSFEAFSSSTFEIEVNFFFSNSYTYVCILKILFLLVPQFSFILLDHDTLGNVLRHVLFDTRFFIDPTNNISTFFF